MQESQLTIDGTYKGDCKKAGETFTTGQRKMMLLFYKLACGRESIIDSTTCQNVNESLFYMEQKSLF